MEVFRDSYCGLELQSTEYEEEEHKYGQYRKTKTSMDVHQMQDS